MRGRRMERRRRWWARSNWSLEPRSCLVRWWRYWRMDRANTPARGPTSTGRLISM
jgi:hypothetical protein